MLKVTVTMDSDRSCDAQFNNDPLSDELPTGIWELQPINNLEGVGKLFNKSINGNGNNAPNKSFSSFSQEEVLFGNLICAVSVFGDDRLAVLTWDGETEPTLQGFVDVGDGPVGIDLRLTANGNIGVISTGFNDNTVTITKLSPSGDVVGNNTHPVLGGCQSPGHAIFVQDSESLKIVGTCYDSGTYFIMDSEL